ncbi:MAG: efflux transporter outer membrane subunit [Steroidobacteraceae bacterium]|jgi:NodT family efflux transporter outer membrane factor (OMF) lipoprotein
MRPARIARIVAMGLIAGLTACAVGPNYRTPETRLPASFSGGALKATGVPGASGAAPSLDLASWWRSMGDAQLNTLVERAVKANFDVEIALTRLQQARTYEAVVAGHALPEVEATAAEARGTGTDLARGRAAQPLVSADNSSGLAHINTLVGFDSVWEIDLFGKYRRAFQAAQFDAQAAAAARYGVLTSVIADVVRAYIDLRGHQVELGVLRQASGVLHESQRIVGERYERGITNELDVTLAERELHTLDAQIAPEEAQVNAAQNAIAVLLGEFPEDIARELSNPELVPTTPEVATPGIPLDLLKRRPDILEAERRLGAATARIGVATAELFPQIALVGSIGAQQGQGAATGQMLGAHLWSFGPAAVWPLLDFGALDAEADIADLEAHASLVSYRSTIVNAVREVDNAMDEYSAQRFRLDELGQAMLAGQRAVELATQRYNRGLTDFLNVVDAQRQYYELQEQYTSAQMTEAEQYVELYKSLGGGWESYQQVPAIRRPQPAIVAAFRRTLGNGGP